MIYSPQRSGGTQREEVDDLLSDLKKIHFASAEKKCRVPNTQCLRKNGQKRRALLLSRALTPKTKPLFLAPFNRDIPTIVTITRLLCLIYTFTSTESALMKSNSTSFFISTKITESLFTLPAKICLDNSFNISF